MGWVKEITVIAWNQLVLENIWWLKCYEQNITNGR